MKRELVVLGFEELSGAFEERIHNNLTEEKKIHTKVLAKQSWCTVAEEKCNNCKKNLLGSRGFRWTHFTFTNENHLRNNHMNGKGTFGSNSAAQWWQTGGSIGSISSCRVHGLWRHSKKWLCCDKKELNTLKRSQFFILSKTLVKIPSKQKNFRMY